MLDVIDGISNINEIIGITIIMEYFLTMHIGIAIYIQETKYAIDM